MRQKMVKTMAVKTRTADMVRAGRVTGGGVAPLLSLVTADGARILTGREVAPDIWRTTTDPDHVIGDDTAKTIADWLKSPAEVDTPLCALAHGRPFSPEALYERARRLYVDSPTDDDGNLARLRALMGWALTWMRHMTLTSWKFTADEWEAAGQGEELDRSRPDTTGVVVLGEYVESIGEWVSPGQPAFPTDLTGVEVGDDGDAWVVGGVVDTTLALLSGTGGGFWAESNGGDPFGPGRYWEGCDPDQRGDEYASRYVHPYSGDVDITVATLVGYTPEESLAVREAWRKNA
jgi:hypothetical protein